MDRLLRYSLDLFAGLIGCVLGLILLFQGMSKLIQGVVMYLTLSGIGADPRAELVGKIIEKSDLQLPGPGVFALFLLMFVGQVVAGGGLLFFGGRGIYRRISIGFPTEEEGKANTLVGKLASIGVFLFGIGIAGAGLVGGTGNMQKKIPIVFWGVEVTGKIDSLVKAQDSASMRTPSYLATISFPGPDGEILTRTERVSYTTYTILRRSNEFDLKYDPANPETFKLKQFVASPLEYIWYFVWRIAFVYVGVCGIQRNLRPVGPTLPRLQIAAGRTSTAINSHSQNIAQRSYSKPTQFGRRGV
ncbi:hypothetical protein [uncultured Roseibium sp.]|uniref:hypothetical protein n=1 Tax=uncultured Roseibium sp. TaxID=1936171 RepID=UPI00260A67A4|nr:hypothetical protein [uncultured Roseibium sp.]